MNYLETPRICHNTSGSHKAVVGNYACKATGAPCTYEEQCIGIPDSQQEVGVTCCNDAGVGSRPQCVSGVDFEQARSFCDGQGLRLCTETEIKSGSGESTGCESDTKLQWTSSSCDVTGRNISNHRLQNLAKLSPFFSSCP